METSNDDDELVVARAETRRDFMECFINENGVERKADLEDLLPVIGKDSCVLQCILSEARSKIDLAAALAHLNDETKEMVYRNVPSWVSGELKKRICKAETNFEKRYVQRIKKELIGLIGEWTRVEYPKNFIWKKAEPLQEKTTEKLAKILTPFEELEKKIEEALDSGRLRIDYLPNEITHDDIQKALQNRFNDLHKIRELYIARKNLPAAALLFETCKIEELSIYSEADCEWPAFLENCQALTKLTFWWSTVNEFPLWIRNASSLRELQIITTKIKTIPDWIGDLQFLTRLSLRGDENMTALPDSIGNLKNLVEFDLENSPIEKLPDSMINLKNLQELYITGSLIKEMPDWIGELQSLTRLSLSGNKNLIKLPNNIGSLKNMVYLNLSDSPIEKLPDTIVNCAALKSVDIFGTKITSVPDFISSVEDFNDNTIIQVIPQKQSVSYICFCNSYYRLVQTMLRFIIKARREGLLALEEELEHIDEGFFKQGMRLVVDGTDAEIIRQILTIKLERENNFYRKKLMQAAMEGILLIQDGGTELSIILLLSSLVDIKNNPLNAACAKYFSGDVDAISNINFEAAIIPEDEREEVSFIKRALELSEKARREGLLALEEYLDIDGIARRNVFEYGLPLIIDGWDAVVIKKILDNLIALETDPVRKNIAQAKQEAILSIAAGDNTRVLLIKLCAYFGEEFEKEMMKFFNAD